MTDLGRTPLLVRLWLLGWHFVPAYVFALTAPLWGQVWLVVVAWLLQLVTWRWVMRRVFTRDGAWTYRGVFRSFTAPVAHVQLEAYGSSSYRARCGGHSVTVYGFAWFEAPGQSLVGITHGGRDAQSQDEGFSVRPTLLSWPEVALSVPIALVSLMAVFAKS